MAQSVTECAIGPTLSSDPTSSIAPNRLTSPKVGRRPVTPQNAEGDPIDPPVSEPSANGTRPAATAAPEPLEDPAAQRLGSQGFRPGPWSDAEVLPL